MQPQGPKKPKMMKFSLYWMYSLIAFLLIGLYYMNDGSTSKEVSWTKFEEIAKGGGIKEMTVYTNKDYVEAFLTDSAAQKIFNTSKENLSKKAKVYTNIASADAISKDIDK